MSWVSQFIFLATGIYSTCISQLIFYQGVAGTLIFTCIFGVCVCALFQVICFLSPQITLNADQRTLVLPFGNYLGMLLVVVIPTSFLSVRIVLCLWISNDKRVFCFSQEFLNQTCGFSSLSISYSFFSSSSSSSIEFIFFSSSFSLFFPQIEKQEKSVDKKDQSPITAKSDSKDQKSMEKYIFVAAVLDMLGKYLKSNFQRILGKSNL